VGTIFQALVNNAPCTSRASPPTTWSSGSSVRGTSSPASVGD